MITLKPRPLTRQAFAPFGEVIELDGAEHFPINEGTTERFHDLVSLDLTGDGGRPMVNIFRGQPRTLPLAIRMMERHPLGSQAFIPLGPNPWIAIVAAAGDPPEPAALVAFLAGPGQGANYNRGVWHHPLIALESVSDFLVIDRGGPGDNCDEHSLAGAEEVQLLL